ncbi:MAG TPA: hypothetical protein VFA85_12520 [Terriglobales bacterium]|nr:hypothetical protein [Terriglobales bacterium]
MKTLSLSVCMAFAFFVASAVAQTTPGAQGTQNSSPSMSQPSQQPGYGQQQPGTQQPGMGQTSDQNSSTQNQDNGERKIKGCVQSQGGQYVLETKKGKQVALAGQDVSAHVGHEVKLTGTWQNGSSMSATSSSNGSGAEKTFNVTNVKMVSESCSGKSSGNMSNSGSTSGSGSTTTPGNSGSQPPQ